MTNEDKLLEIAEAEYTDLPGATRYNEIMATNRTNLIARVTALISEHYYPKEFLLWTHHQDYWLFDIITDLWYSDDDPQLLHEITTDELFSYWKENER